MLRMDSGEIYSLLDSIFAALPVESWATCGEDFADMIREIADGSYEDTVQEWLRDHGYG